MALQVHTKYPSEVLWATMSFKNKLAPGELLDGTPSVEDCEGELYFSEIQINTETLILASGTEYEEVVSSGEAVQFLVASGDIGEKYKMVGSCQTAGNSAPVQTLYNVAELRVIKTS